MKLKRRQWLGWASASAIGLMLSSQMNYAAQIYIGAYGSNYGTAPYGGDLTLDTDDDGVADLVDLDDDNDGVTDVNEMLLGSNPLDSNSRATLAIKSMSGNTKQLSFTTAMSKNYMLQSSVNLKSWQNVNSFVGTGSSHTMDVIISASEPKKFFRIIAQ
jgi:hypothetical protein